MSLKVSRSDIEDPQGKITLITGCVFAGKTTELLRVIERYSRVGVKCILIKHKTDQRYSAEEVVSHDQTRQKSVAFSTISEAHDIIEESKVIGIDEGQFFPDIVDAADYWAERGKLIYITFPNGTFEMKPFGNLHGIYAIAEDVLMLNAICPICRNAAYFSKRLTDSTKEIEIGGGDKYSPACRKHFNMDRLEFKACLEKSLNKSS